MPEAKPQIVLSNDVLEAITPKEPDDSGIGGAIVSDLSGTKVRNYEFTKKGRKNLKSALDAATRDFNSDVDVVVTNNSRHNDSDYVKRLKKENTYRDLSTIIICPTRGMIPSRVVANWQYMRPMNQKVIGPIFLERMEVGEAYNQGIKMILENPDLAKFKYVLTVEEDNYPQNPDGLLKLYEHIDEYDCIGGLYWTKGENGQPMCYGNPDVMPLNFVPQIPTPGTLTPCNGLGMGFNLWRLEMFKDKRFEYGQWFKTRQEFVPGVGAAAYTQDLYFFEKARGLGYKFACDARVPVVHWDEAQQIAW